MAEVGRCAEARRGWGGDHVGGRGRAAAKKGDADVRNDTGTVAKNTEQRRMGHGGSHGRNVRGWRRHGGFCCRTLRMCKIGRVVFGGEFS